MPRPLYSSRLWFYQFLASNGTAFGPTVPAGFTWVVRDVRMVNTQPQTGLHVGALVLLSSAGPKITATPTFFSVTGELYHWEGRGMVPAGESLQLVTDSNGWEAVVDGYQLSAT